jgi:hypothetical protein
MDTVTTPELDGKAVKVLPEVAREFTLPSGRKVEIRPITLDDVLEAQEYSEGKQKAQTLMLLHLTVKIDGEKVFPEDFGKMTIPESAPILDAFGKLNGNF